MTWKTKSRCASDGGETNAPFSQSVWINRGESNAVFTAQKMALMGFDIIGRVCGGAMCRWRVIYAWHCCLPIQLPAAIHHTARCIAGWLTPALISGSVKVGQAGPIFLSASLCFNIVCHQAQGSRMLQGHLWQQHQQQQKCVSQFSGLQHEYLYTSHVYSDL